MIESRHTEKRSMMWIGGFKLLQALLLTLIATGVLAFIHRDVEAIVEHWVKILHLHPENIHIAAFLKKLGLVHDRQIEQLSGIAFAYAGLLVVEGVGVMKMKQWAKYLAAIDTAAFIPIELYEVTVNFGFGKLIALVVNVVIVWFLIRALMRDRALKRHPVSSLAA